MKPIKFKEVNVTYAENQPEYLPLPVYRKEGNEGEVVSCWKLTFRERLKILFTGRMWLGIWTFRGSLQPVLPTVNKTDLIASEGGAE